MTSNPHERYKNAEALEQQRQYDAQERERIRSMSDQELKEQYTCEIRNLRTTAGLKRQGQPRGDVPHGDTSLVNRCRQELKRRGLPVPVVRVPFN